MPIPNSVGVVHIAHSDRNKGREDAQMALGSCFTLTSLKSWLNHENPEFWLGWIVEVVHFVRQTLISCP